MQKKTLTLTKEFFIEDDEKDCHRCDLFNYLLYWHVSCADVLWMFRDDPRCQGRLKEKVTPEEVKK